MRTWLLVTLLAAVGLAGCADDGEPEPETTEEVMQAEVEQPLFGPHSGLPRERAADFAPTLAAPPQWVLGEYWTIEATDHFVGSTHQITRIVAGKEGPNYLVGQPLDSFNDEIMVLHLPGFGLIHSDSLGVESHDYLFEPLAFPLTVDATWDTEWERPATSCVQTFQVTSADPAAGTAEVQGFGCQNMFFTYDAEMGAITEFLAPGYMEYRVTGHGYGWEGTVRVPHSHDLIFFDGRLGPVVDIANGATALVDAPIETLTVPDIYDRTSFALIAFELLPFLQPGTEPVARSAVSITTTAPDGTAFDLTKLPTETGHKLASFGHDSPGGDWTLQVVNGGIAQSFIEGIGYITFDVELPSGCVLLTSKIHDHGGDCGGHVHDIE